MRNRIASVLSLACLQLISAVCDASIHAALHVLALFVLERRTAVICDGVMECCHSSFNLFESLVVVSKLPLQDLPKLLPLSLWCMLATFSVYIAACWRCSMFALLNACAAVCVCVCVCVQLRIRTTGVVNDFYNSTVKILFERDTGRKLRGSEPRGDMARKLQTGLAERSQRK